MVRVIVALDCTFFRPCALGHEDKHLFVDGDCPLLASDGGFDGSLSFHHEVGHHHVPVQCGQVDDWTKVSCLFRNQQQPAVEPGRCLVTESLYGPLGQQGIHSLLEILAAVPGAEIDALVGELRSL